MNTATHVHLVLVRLELPDWVTDDKFKDELEDALFFDTDAPVSEVSIDPSFPCLDLEYVIVNFADLDDLVSKAQSAVEKVLEKYNESP